MSETKFRTHSEPQAVLLDSRPEDKKLLDWVVASSQADVCICTDIRFWIYIGDWFVHVVIAVFDAVCCGENSLSLVSVVISDRCNVRRAVLVSAASWSSVRSYLRMFRLWRRCSPRMGSKSKKDDCIYRGYKSQNYWGFGLYPSSGF
jgi:hypothetical protein